MYKEVDMNILFLIFVIVNYYNLLCVYFDYILFLFCGFYVCYLKYIKEIEFI